MPTAIADGILTRYEVVGSGPPLLMFAPGGFDATIEKWTTQGVYARIKPVEHLSRHYACIVFDRRECGESGGRLEAVTWAHYVRQGKGLLDHLGIPRAHVMGACMGCGPAMAFGVAHAEATTSLVLYWPVGGARYRINSHARFSEHLAFARQHGLDGVVSRAIAEGKPFNRDAPSGPWATVIQHDGGFARAYAREDVQRYEQIVTTMAEALFDRDTAPGAQPEDLFRLEMPTLIVPGQDETHATSAARYLKECIARSEYWDVAVADQTEATVPSRLIEFLGSTSLTP